MLGSPRRTRMPVSRPADTWSHLRFLGTDLRGKGQNPSSSHAENVSFPYRPEHGGAVSTAKDDSTSPGIGPQPVPLCHHRFLQDFQHTDPTPWPSFLRLTTHDLRLSLWLAAWVPSILSFFPKTQNQGCQPRVTSPLPPPTRTEGHPPTVRWHVFPLYSVTCLTVSLKAPTR